MSLAEPLRIGKNIFEWLESRVLKVRTLPRAE